MSMYISSAVVVRGNPSIACKRISGAAQLVADADGAAQIQSSVDGTMAQQVNVSGMWQRCPDKDNGVTE